MRLFRTFSKFREIKASSDRETTARYAILSMIMSVLAVGFAALFGFGMKSMDSNAVVGMLIIILGAVVAVGCILYAMLYNLFQLILNRRWTTFVSIIVFVGAVVAAYFAITLMMK